jgi:carboxymethylenebutenolidase
MGLDWLSNAYEGMSRRQFLAQMSNAGIGLAGFAIAANAIAGEIITTSSDGIDAGNGFVSSENFQIPIYHACPKTSGKYPVIIIIPEIFGLHEHIKDVTRRFAKEGFLAISFEPYAREGGVLNLPNIDAVRKIVDPVPDERVMKDMDAIIAYAAKLPAARADRIGMTGFCRGGLYTLLFAARNREVKAAVPWYGQLKPAKTPGVRTFGPLDVADKISCPVLGLYGDADMGIPADDVRQMEAALKAAGKTAEFVLYPGAPHAFFADYRPSYRPEAATDAWKRCITWFNKHLEQ